jgi:hypothetical protein
MPHAPEHVKELINRSIRRWMGTSGVPCSASQQARRTESPLDDERAPGVQRRSETEQRRGSTPGASINRIVLSFFALSESPSPVSH